MKRFLLNNVKVSFKKLIKLQIFKKFAIITKNKFSDLGFVSIGAKKSNTKYKISYLGKETTSVDVIKIDKNIFKEVDKLSDQFGLVVIKGKELLDGLKNMVVMQPDFISLEIPLPNTSEEYFKSITGDARNNLKKVKKLGISFKISSDKKWVNKFYNDYYLPTMVGRHSEDAGIITINQTKALIHKQGAEFIQVFLEEKCIAAALTILSGEKYIYEKVGYLKGDNKSLEHGAATAIYQILIERAFELGCKSINLGGTPSFLENGVLKYKAKWMPRFCPNIYFDENYLLLKPSNKNCYEFLKKNSLVVFDLNNSLIVLSSKTREETNIPGTLLDDIKSWYILRQFAEYPAIEGLENLPEHLRCWYQQVI